MLQWTSDCSDDCQKNGFFLCENCSFNSICHLEAKNPGFIEISPSKT